MDKTQDDFFMTLALAEAHAAAKAGEVPVGAVLVKAGEVIARSHNQPITKHDPTAHAEIMVLRAAAQRLENYRLNETSLYVTLEPCAMCAGAISMARIGRLIYGAEDPKGGAVLHGPKFFNQPTCHHAPSIFGGLMAADSSALLKEFFRARRS